MAGTSTRTKVYSVRLPIAVGAIAERRVRGESHGGQPNCHDSVSSYLRGLLIYALTKKWGASRVSEQNVKKAESEIQPPGSSRRLTRGARRETYLET
jgi:hypothetical protein